MNTNLYTAIKQLTAQHGEAILSDSKQVSSLLSGMAANEPKPQRIAFVKCLMYGFQTDLKNTQPNGRAACKERLVNKLCSEEGMERLLAKDTLDLLEMVLFGSVSGAPNPAPQPPPRPAPIPTAPPPTPVQVNIPAAYPPTPPQNQPSSPPSGEMIIYEANGVLISTTRFVAFGKTYAMSNISSVEMMRIPNKDRKGLEKWRIICGIAIIPLYRLFKNLTAPIVALAVCVFLTMAINKCKDTYIVKLSSNSGETNALSSEDYAHIRSVVNALNEALIKRG